MHRITLHLALLGLAAAAGAARAQPQPETIWSCKDKSGRTHVTNIKDDTKGMQCRVLREQRLTVVAPSALEKSRADAARKAAAERPREDGAARASARDRQRQILETELANEESLLAKARADLNEQEAVRGGDERNYARVLERLKPFQDSVETHQKNIESLKRELANLSR